MDRKSFIILAVTGILFLTWPRLINKIFPPVPAPPGSTNTVALTTNKSGQASLTAAPTNAFAAVTNTAAISTNTPRTAQTFVLQNEWAKYHFSSIGGGIELVELTQFKSQVGCRGDKVTNNPP